MATSDDRCVIEKQPRTTTTQLPPLVGLFKVADNRHGGVTIILLIIIILLVIGVALTFRSNRYSTPQPRSNSTEIRVVPFVVLHDSVPSQHGSHRKSYHDLLRQVMDNYQREGSQALSGLSSMLNEALTSEASFAITSNNKKWLSTKIDRRIQKTAECLEHDEKVLKRLLGNFSYVMALPHNHKARNKKADNTTTTNNTNNNNNSTVSNRQQTSSTKFRMPNQHAYQNSSSSSSNDTHSYDSATQIWAHLVRDWTNEGKAIRHALYDWCAKQMKVYCCCKNKKNSTVLVPGSGMGRLAYDLSQLGHNVEANELSPSMAAAAKSVLSGYTNGSFHPYLLDGMANEVDSARRFKSVGFPDVNIRAPSKGSLSYTVGDFAGSDYYRNNRANDFDVIVTCFLIDTATNIYDYIQVIQNLLRPHGVWINVGPVQWHHNALLRPSVDELKDILEACGWKLKVWSIDTKPISYRDQNSDEKMSPMTSYDGYRPLRFVAIKSQ